LQRLVFGSSTALPASTVTQGHWKQPTTSPLALPLSLIDSHWLLTTTLFIWFEQCSVGTLFELISFIEWQAYSPLWDKLQFPCLLSLWLILLTFWIWLN
jgi:hypothetical protein